MNRRRVHVRVSAIFVLYLRIVLGELIVEGEAPPSARRFSRDLSVQEFPLEQLLVAHAASEGLC